MLNFTSVLIMLLARDYSIS